MSFVEDHGPDRVQLWEGEAVNILDNMVHQEAEVPGTFNASIDIMPCSDGEQVINVRLLLSGLTENELKLTKKCWQWYRT